MRLALQATFDDLDGTTDESRRRRARCERELEQNRRSFAFYRKLSSIVDDPNVKAPEVFAQESFPDPNVVAEYLDYRSESEDVATEYERACWDSPEALAEVGDCYDILVNDLPKPIDSPKNCRRRLYYVAWEEYAQTGRSAGTRRESEKDVHTYDDKRPLNEAGTDVVEKRTTYSNAEKDEKRKNKNDVKVGATPKQESDVQRTMRKERNARRRLRSNAMNAIVLLCVLSFGIWALGRTRNDRNSETFQLTTAQTNETNQIENDVAKVDDSNGASSNRFEEGRTNSSDKRNEVPRVADLRVGNHNKFDAGDALEPAPNWGTEPNAFGESNDDALAITHVDDESTNSAFPSVDFPPEYENFGQESVATSGVSRASGARSAEKTQSVEQKRVRVGLRGGLNESRRKNVEIPSQNNDVFAAPRRY